MYIIYNLVCINVYDKYVYVLFIAVLTISPLVAIEVRLAGGPEYNGCGSSSEGRVEVLYNGTWGTVCRDGWDLNDANVTCRMLGYERALEASGASLYGDWCKGSVISNVECSGSEQSLEDCRYSTFHLCSSHDAAGVVCDRGPWGMKKLSAILVLSTILNK